MTTSTIPKQRTYQYWSVNCHHCAIPIPIRRYRGGQPEWPEEFDSMECPHCGVHERYCRAEVNRDPTPFEERIPLVHLPTLRIGRRVVT
jgi:hypothetical protein